MLNANAANKLAPSIDRIVATVKILRDRDINLSREDAMIEARAIIAADDAKKVSK